MEVEWPIILYRFTKRMSRGEENEGEDLETHEEFWGEWQAINEIFCNAIFATSDTVLPFGQHF
jgi:hypothetical protein